MSPLQVIQLYNGQPSTVLSVPPVACVQFIISVAGHWCYQIYHHDYVHHTCQQVTLQRISITKLSRGCSGELLNCIMLLHHDSTVDRNLTPSLYVHTNLTSLTSQSGWCWSNVRCALRWRVFTSEVLIVLLKLYNKFVTFKFIRWMKLIICSSLAAITTVDSEKKNKYRVTRTDTSVIRVTISHGRTVWKNG